MEAHVNTRAEWKDLVDGLSPCVSLESVQFPEDRLVTDEDLQNVRTNNDNVDEYDVYHSYWREFEADNRDLKNVNRLLTNDLQKNADVRDVLHWLARDEQLSNDIYKYSNTVNGFVERELKLVKKLEKIKDKILYETRERTSFCEENELLEKRIREMYRRRCVQQWHLEMYEKQIETLQNRYFL